MCPLEGVGGGERLIIHHATAGLDCQVFMVPLWILLFLYRHLEGTWPSLGNNLVAGLRESRSSGPGALGRLMAAECLELEAARCRQPWGCVQRGQDRFSLEISGWDL